MGESYPINCTYLLLGRLLHICNYNSNLSSVLGKFIEVHVQSFFFVFLFFRLASVKNDSSKFYLRGKIREKLLHIIQNLTVYDKVNMQS